MGRDSWSTTPEVTPWFFVCCGLAIPVVYWFEQAFYEAIVIVFLGLAGFSGRILDGLLQFANAGFFAALISLLIGLPICLALIVLVIPCAIAKFLATSPGPVPHLLDPFFVCYVAAFLYGVLFPILWRLSEPVIAHTLGELAFQRARARVYGERPRYSQPLYLVVALIGLIGGIGRIAVPASETAAAAAATGWHQVSDPVFRPQWPKGFKVVPGAPLATGIRLQANEELILQADGAVSVSIEPGGTHYQYQLTPGTWTAPWGFDGRPGELYLWAGSRPVTVWVSGAPENHGRMWMHALATPTPQRAAARRHARRATGHR